MNTEDILSKLRKDGYDVVITHYRYISSKIKVPQNHGYDYMGTLKCGLKSSSEIKRLFAVANDEFDMGLYINPLGGATTITVFSDNSIVYRGTSSCHWEDLFSRKLGSKIVTRRALKHLT